MSVDLLIFILFLSINLTMGLYWGRGVKNIQEYAIGNRNFKTTTLVATIVATFLGGDYLFITLDEVYRTGLHYAIGCLGMPIALIMAAFIFIPRMGEFLGNLSAAESIGQIYGREIRVIAGICGTICISGFIAIQFRVFGSAMGYVAGISPDVGIVLSAFIVIIYSAFGGIRSVTLTDVIQFVTFFMILPLIAFKIWYLVTGNPNTSILNTIANSEFDYKKYLNVSGSHLWQVIFLLMLFLIPEFNPALFQRIMIGNNILQVKKAYTISGIIIFAILVLMSWIAFLLYTQDTTLNSRELVQYIITQDFHEGFRGLFVVGIVAMAMSTADSNINTSAVLIVHDVLKPMNKNISNELLIAKLVSLIIGVCSIFLAFSKFNLLELVFFTQQFYIPIISPLILMAVLGFRSGKNAAYLGIIAGFIFSFWWRFTYMDQTGVDCMLIGMIANLAVFISSHYLLKEPGGWVGIKDNATLVSIRLERKRKWGLFANSIKNFNIIEFCKKRAPKNELTYTSFGLFSIISVFATVYSNFNVGMRYNSILYIYEVIIIISLIFIVYPILPQKIKKDIIIQVSWLISVFFVLVVMPTVFLLISGISRLQLLTFSLNLLVSLLLTRGKLGLLMLFFGVYVGMRIFDVYFGNATQELQEFPISFYLIYALLMTTSVFIILLKPTFKKEDMESYIHDRLKKKYNEQKIKIIESSEAQGEFIRVMDSMVIDVFRKLKPQVGSVLKKIKATKSKTELTKTTQELVGIIDKLKNSATYLSKVIDQVMHRVSISITSVDVLNLLNEVCVCLNNVYKHNVVVDFKSTYNEIQCDPQFIKELMEIIMQKVTNKPVLIHDSKLKFDIDLLKSKKSFIEVEAIKFIFFVNYEVNGKIKEDELLYIKRLILAHYGKIEFINEQKESLIIVYLPVAIKKLRPKFMDAINTSSGFLSRIQKKITHERKETLIRVVHNLQKMGMSTDEIAKAIELSTDEVKQLFAY